MKPSSDWEVDGRSMKVGLRSRRVSRVYEGID